MKKHWRADIHQEPIRMIVVGDQLLLRELHIETSCEVVGTASNGLEAIELSHQMRPDVVLIDVKMPSMDGIEVVRQMKATLPHIPVILLTTFTTADGYTFEGLAVGANDLLSKDTSIAMLLSTIRTVYAEKHIDLPLQSIDGLTERETQTLVLIAKGMIVKQVARALAISEKTVRNHIRNIYSKLGVYDRSQIVIYAIKKGLVDIYAI